MRSGKGEERCQGLSIAMRASSSSAAARSACAVAYALTAKGERDVLLLEKAQLTNGCTWHAAGLVGQLRGSAISPG